MIILSIDEKPESYKSYKNRTFKKHIDKITNQLSQIKQCSLSEADKKILRQKIFEIIISNP